MTFASVGTLGATGSKSANQSSLTHTTTAAAEAGNLVVVVLVCDNNGTTDGDEGAVSSITDSAGGNTWSKGAEFTNTSGAAQDGTVCSIWFSRLTNQIASGGTITANFTNSTSRDATAMTTWEFTVASSVSVEATATLAHTGDDPLNATTSNIECLRVRGITGEHSSSTSVLTPTTNWTAFTDTGTSGGQQQTNQSLSAEFHISTGTSDQSDPTWSLNFNEQASVYVALKEAAAAQSLVYRPTYMDHLLVR